MSAGVWAAVAAVGGLGAVARFLTDRAIRRVGQTFPWGVLVINLSGSFALGLLTGLAITGNALLIAGTATLGSYTTFSTWVLDSERLAEDGAGASAALNLVGSLLAGLAVAALGKTLGGWLH